MTLPLLWRYLLSQYTKFFIFCLLAFICVLLTTRLEDIAHFATMGPGPAVVALFVLYQIPYILPIAIPISCLISAFVLYNRLSKSHELTALRASGISLLHIISPILLASLFISLMNFILISEVATHSHLSTNRLKRQLRNINPLVLLDNKHFQRSQEFFFRSYDEHPKKDYTQKLVFALPTPSQSRLSLFVANELQSKSNTLDGSQVTLLTAFNSGHEHTYDQIAMENIEHQQTPTQEFTSILEKGVWHINHDYLQLPLLLLRLQDYKKNINSSPEKEAVKQNINRIYSDIYRRVSGGFSVFAFTLMGIAFGVGIGRNRRVFAIPTLVLLTALYLSCFLSGKSAAATLPLSAALYFGPHVIIVITSLLSIRRVAKGQE